MKGKYKGHLSKVGREFLNKIGVSSKPSILKSASIIGQGYNILTDKTMAPQIFVNELIDHDGIMIPKASLYEKVNETKEFMEYFEESRQAVEYRMKKLNISLGIDLELLPIGSRTGMTIGQSKENNSSNVVYSFLMESRNFKLKMGNYSSLTVTDEFLKAVKNLPQG